jgi:hypothetical protein
MLRAIHMMLFIAATIFVSQAYAECSRPETASIPNGTTATSEEMVEAQTYVKQYIAEMELYLACLDQQEAALTEPPAEEQAKLHTQLHNNAVDSMENVAAKFNEQVRAFKKANP